MDQSFHVAIIMDGNGRWAQARGLPRIAGHRRGADAVRRVIESAPGFGIRILTLYAFSSDNWKRPAAEVAALMGLFCHYLDAEVDECVRNGVRLNVIGRRDRLPAPVLAAMQRCENATRNGGRLHLRLAVDYSSRDAIVEAGRRAALHWIKTRGCGAPETAWFSRETFSDWIGSGSGMGGAPDVDLLIRTGGEQRLSDFLLWECAYAEFLFTHCMWPDFGAAELGAAVADFRSRQRRFGAVAG
jgi:undecaprenyl diphosphate synthase